jgi:hypothetical protein
MHPARALAMVEAMGGCRTTLRLVACEPAVVDEDELSIGLSPPVAAAVERAVDLTLSVLADLASESAASSVLELAEPRHA